MISTRKQALTVLLACLVGAGSSPPGVARAASKDERLVRGARIELVEVVPGAPEEYQGIDLGPAPPPGGSRVLGRDELSRRITASGFELGPVARLLPESIKVVSEAEELSASQLAERAQPVVARQLREGVVLEKLTATRGLKLPVGSRLGRVEMPAIPRRVGSRRTSAILVFECEGEVVARPSVAVVVRVSERGAQPDVSKDSVMELVLRAGGATVSARATALSEGDVGDVINLRIHQTQKILRGKVLSSHTAEVVAK